VKVPVALRFTITPAGSDRLAGAMSIVTKVALVTVNIAEALSGPDAVETVAVIVVVPAPKPLATALCKEIVATLLAEEFQFAVVVML
jgi:hypothetical protein